MFKDQNDYVSTPPTFIKRGPVLRDLDKAWSELSDNFREELSLPWEAFTHVMKARALVEKGELSRPLWVALYGGTNVGKSAFFNLLLNEELSPSKAIASATRQPVIALSEQQRDTLLPFREFGRLSTVREALSEPKSLEEAGCYVHTYPQGKGPLALCEGADLIALIDCPDHDSASDMNRMIAELVVGFSDRCIYLTTPQKYKTISTQEALFKLSDQGIRVGVLFNQLTAEQKPETLWSDLIETMSVEFFKEDQKRADRFKNEVFLLGGLPRISLKDPIQRDQMRAQCLQVFQQALEGASPSHLIEEEMRDQVWAIFESLQNKSLRYLQDQKSRVREQVEDLNTFVRRRALELDRRQGLLDKLYQERFALSSLEELLKGGWRSILLNHLTQSDTAPYFQELILKSYRIELTGLSSLIQRLYRVPTPSSLVRVLARLHTASEPSIDQEISWSIEQFSGLWKEYHERQELKGEYDSRFNSERVISTLKVSLQRDLKVLLSEDRAKFEERFLRIRGVHLRRRVLLLLIILGISLGLGSSFLGGFMLALIGSSLLSLSYRLRFVTRVLRSGELLSPADRRLNEERCKVSLIWHVESWLNAVWMSSSDNESFDVWEQALRSLGERLDEERTHAR